LLVLAGQLRAPEGTLLQVVPALMAALAEHAADIPEAVLWEADVEAISAPASGWRLQLNPPGRALLLDPTGLTVELSDGTRVRLPGDAELDHPSMRLDHPFTGLGAPALGVQLSLHDANPLSMDEAHPDKTGNAVDLGQRAPGEWTARLEEALELIELALPGWHAEIEGSLDRILPVGFEPEMHLSASYREAPGVVYMTLHPDPLTMAEAIIHEAQHGKINRLTWLDPVLHNAYTTWTESPVRPDLRPLMGVLLAVHAFIPVAALHHRLAAMDHPLSQTPRFAERRQQVLAGNAGGLDIVLAKAEPTPTGARLIADLQALHQHVMVDQTNAGWDSNALPPG